VCGSRFEVLIPVTSFELPASSFGCWPYLMAG
jgi:hypothetical protein